MSRSNLIQRTITVGLAGALLLSVAGWTGAAPVLSNTAAIKSNNCTHGSGCAVARPLGWQGLARRMGRCGRSWASWEAWRWAPSLSAPYSYYGYGPSYGYAPYGYAPTYYGYYGAPSYGYGYGYYGSQRPW